MMGYQGFGNGWYGMMGTPAWDPFFSTGLVALVLWSLFWKGLALWHSAQRGENVWFLILLILNTAGILEIVYLFLVAKIKFDELFTNKHRRAH